MMFELTVNVLGESVAEKLNEVDDTCKVGFIPDCVTLTVRGVRSWVLTETVPERCSVLVWAAAVTEIVPLFVPDVGLTVSQSAFLLTVQVVLEATVNSFGVSVALKLSVGGVTVSKGAEPIDTGMVRGGRMPVPVMVSVAVRFSVASFAWARTVTVPFFAPDDGVIVTHEASLSSLHAFVLESIVSVCSSPLNGK